ncbi:ATP-binding protein [Methylorubrum thiocyanatum]|uniref:ATP-binding protein n=1 Tax=Methylorubrum thiocyanatum TaxID=47958 RepID=UPI003F7E7F37
MRVEQRAGKVGHTPGAATAAQRGQDLDVIVGKDVLELVSSAMYVDPMTVYREYIQNAADATDDARRLGLLAPGEPGRVDITLDAGTRSVRIRDNGTGLPERDFFRRLTALGASTKRGTIARGFRGVGRLAGLGYAQELVFRSRATGERLVSELRWDCRRLKAALRGAEADTGLADLVREVVTVGHAQSDDNPERFFEVELRGIIRLRSDKLMSASAISDYLGQVAPVPFSPEFRFGAEITAALRGVVELGELHIHVDGHEEPLYRPHRDHFPLDERRSAAFESLELAEVPGIDGGVAAVAWVLHHDYEGAVPTAVGLKGLRMRAGNVQVGDHTLLEELFPEPRFNVWSVGEVHVIDRRVVPNGRRDHFEQTSHLHNLINHLTPLARGVARRCRTSSVRRKWLREFGLLREAVEAKLSVIGQGSLGESQRDSTALVVEQALLQMEKVASMDLLVDDDPEDLRGTVSNLRRELGRLMRDDMAEPSPLGRLPAEKRAMYEHLFELIYACSANRTAAKALVDRILLRIT